MDDFQIEARKVRGSLEPFREVPLAPPILSSCTLQFLLQADAGLGLPFAREELWKGV